MVAPRTVLACGMALVPVWGYVLPHFLMLDALALGPACLGGALGALAAVLSTIAAAIVRRRISGRSEPHSSALDLAVLATASALATWVTGPRDGRLPYLEGFALAALDVAAAWAAALAAYVLQTQQRRRLTEGLVDTPPGWRPTGPHDAPPARSIDQRPPTLRSVFALTSAGLALVAAIVLSVGSLGRASGARARQIVTQTQALADLSGAVLQRLPEDAVAERRRVVEVLSTHGETEAVISPPGERPPALAAIPPLRVAETEDGFLTLSEEGRIHWLSRPIPGGTLWVRANVLAPPAVLAPDDAPALLILAILVLAAPLATGLVGQQLAGDLAEISRALSAAGGDTEREVPFVPVRSDDEIGDVAVALNETLRDRADENRRLAWALEGAQASDRARNRFLAGASHELRTPLNAITGYCHLLLRSPITEAQREDISLIEAAGEQLLGHVDEILDLSRIESGQDAPLDCRPTDLGALVRQVVLARSKDVPPGVDFGATCDPATPMLSVDALRIRQTLENLVGNALKFTRKGYVQITVGPHPDGVHLQVVDSGPGIPADELESIFAEFHRVEGQRQVAGTGLGLAIARRFVDQHGGSLWAESILGQGTTFHLVLPDSSRGGTS